MRQWAVSYNGPDDLNEFSPVVAVDAGGNVIVAAASVSGFNMRDYYTAKYAAVDGAVDGALLWEVRYDGPAHLEDEPQAVAVDAAGNVIVTGSSRFVGGIFSTDMYTAKYAAATGALVWEQRFHEAGGGWHRRCDGRRGFRSGGSDGSPGGFLRGDLFGRGRSAAVGAALLRSG